MSTGIPIGANIGERASPTFSGSSGLRDMENSPLKRLKREEKSV